jgi:arsenate reductase
VAATDPELLANALRKEAEPLFAEFAGTFNAETIMLLVSETYALLAARARVDVYLPLLTYRFARERLLAQARVRGASTNHMPEVLFVCVHNAGRSQMAAALTASLSSGSVHVRSAGSAPTESINARVVEAMAEIGIDLSAEFPKPLTDDVVESSDVVITMGCGDACPMSTPASATSTGRSTTRRVSRSKSCAASATTSRHASGRYWESWG